MSSLVSLQLLGIRSFGPDDEDVGVVKFLSPITLILGDNGCGKTTIIESIKFATCGELPDNTNRGQGFLFDPHLAGNIETRGFVKLKFIDINGDSLVITRPMQVTQKPKNLEFKRLDSAIKLTKPNGESTSLSSRCSDIDNLVTSSMGVSKAILTNVIFCHQEDSSWPLDEGKKVKERFDAIFDSKKYNTCLENIRKLRKTSQTDLRVMKTELLNLSERKNEASSKRVTLSETESRMAASRDRVKALKENLRPITMRLRDIAEKEDSIGKLQTDYETHKARHSSVQEVIKDLKSRIQFEFSGTDDELKNAVDNFQEEFSNKQHKLEKLETESEEVESEIKLKQNEVNEEQVKVGQLSRDIDRYNERIESRNKTLLQLCVDLQVEDVTMGQLSQGMTEVDRAFRLIEEAISEKQDDASDMKNEHESMINQLQIEVDSIREKKAKTESAVEHKKQLIVNGHKECDKLKRDIGDVDKSADSLNRLQTKLERVKRELEDLTSSYDVEKFEKDIETAKLERNKFEDDLNVIDKEVQSMQKLSSLKAEIDIQKEAKISKEGEAQKLVRRHRDTLKELLGEVPEQGIKIKFHSCLSQLGEEIKCKREEIKISEREVTKLETEKKHLLDKLRMAKQNLTSDECLIDQECGNKDYDSYLTELSSKVQELQDQKGSLTSSDYMFRRYVQKLEEQDPCCPLCHRDFPTDEDVSNLVLELTLKMREVPSKLRTSKEKLEESQEKYKKLLQLKPKYDKLSNLKNVEIPTLQSDLERTDKKMEKSQQRLYELQKDLSVSQSSEECAKNIQGDVVLLEQHWNDVKRLDREIQKLEARLPPGSNRCTLEEAIEEQAQLRSQVSNARLTLENLQTKSNSVTSKKQKLQEEKNSIQEQQMKISGNAQMRSQLTEKLNETENSLCTLQGEIDRDAEELEELTVKLENSSGELKSRLAYNTKILQDVTSKLRVIEQRFKDIKKNQDLICEFELSGSVEKMKSIQTNLTSLKRSGEKLEAIKQAVQSELGKLKTHLASQKTHERDLVDNVKLRAKLIEEKELSERVKSLNLVIGSMNYVSITVEKNKLRLEEEGINRDRAHAEGRQRELENTISNLKSELNQDLYKNADKNHKDKLVQIRVEELAIDDMNKYYVALDWALTHFHQEKMRAINSTIRDLWRQIYKGNDIDSIEIKTDVDHSANADKRRTYNYRVIQKKSGAEMEMRGRCSAGQKVLACLIIRMALAETFSANCGILALDEPTTNLDHRNIASLSEALVEIVNRRSLQKNFQLIIISHDKTFLDVLQTIDKSQYYYEISRNHNGRSRIEKITAPGRGE